MLLVFFYIVVFTGLRTATIEYILAPFAHKLGVNKKKERIRFAEQAWIFIYYTAFWSLGMVRIRFRLRVFLT
jgi:acyl-CoA-dependent ceramide synthase